MTARPTSRRRTSRPTIALFQFDFGIAESAPKDAIGHSGSGEGADPYGGALRFSSPARHHPSRARPASEPTHAAEGGSIRMSVVPSWTLGPYLEANVPVRAAAIDVRMRQQPEVRPESHRPKFFAEVPTIQGIVATPPSAPAPPPTPDTLGGLLRKVAAVQFRREGAAKLEPEAADLARDLGIDAEMRKLLEARGRDHFETETGFTIRGAGVVDAYAGRWRVSFERGDPGVTHVRLEVPKNATGSLALAFERDIGTVLGVLPGLIGSVVVDGTRIVSVNYVPSSQTFRYQEYAARARELEQMKAFAAVAARNGRFVVENERAAALADRIRQLKGLDPTLGIYAAYAYLQAGDIDDIVSVFRYMESDDIPVPFDVALLAARFEEHVVSPNTRVAPFGPMLTEACAWPRPRVRRKGVPRPKNRAPRSSHTPIFGEGGEGYSIPNLRQNSGVRPLPPRVLRAGHVGEVGTRDEHLVRPQGR